MKTPVPEGAAVRAQPRSEATQASETLTHGPDPLHLAEVFGLDEKTAMRYADSARALLEQTAEADPAG
ncbi:hypothetical protein NRF20_05935 [Streptomyces sp. R-74717]|uniref:hypothetical protein n=1 Tax=Streptomyces TaxID=1883 RepID=UPI0037A8D9D7